MRILAGAALLLFACRPTAPIGLDADPFDDEQGALSLSLPVCRVAALDEPFLFTSTFDREGTLTFEITRPDGTTRVLSREAVLPQQSMALSVPPSAWGEGKNTVRIWIYRTGLMPAGESFEVDARARVASVSGEDQDGDCYSPALGDCHDGPGGVAIHPGLPEVCGDRIDNNCDGLLDFADPVCAAGCADDDGDGFASAVCGGNDCDDKNAAVNPTASETCNGIDDNCNERRDETFDLDHDGFVDCTPEGDASVAWRVESGTCPEGLAACRDCDDLDNTTYPGAYEPCDEKLHNCAGTLAQKFADRDADGVVDCRDPDSDNDGICDPGAQVLIAIEPCATPEAADGVCCSHGPRNAPDNCPLTRNHAQTDADEDGLGDACDACTDIDADGYGRDGTYDRNGALAPTGAAALVPGTSPALDDPAFSLAACVALAPDCYDHLSARGRATWPDAPELCNGFDDDCDALADEGLDSDGDGFNACGSLDGGTIGVPSPALADCREGLTADDTAVHPGAAEICDGIDNDCKSGVDEGCDDDNDNFCEEGKLSVGTPPTCTAGVDDCNDAEAGISPAMTELSCDGIDNDCNGQIDENDDGDFDGFVDCPSATWRTAPGVPCPSGFVTCQDCNDESAVSYPGAVEICFNGLDDDCSAPPGVEEPDWTDADCCNGYARFPFIRTGGFGDTLLESFEDYDHFIQIPQLGTGSLPATPVVSTVGGWERTNLSAYCNQIANADISWRIRSTTLFQLASMPLGSMTAGTYGNGGSWAWNESYPDGCTSTADCACLQGTGCYNNSGLVSPPIDFSTISPAAPARDGNDLVILEYRRFAAHDTSGGTMTSENLKLTSNNICDRSSAYGGGLVPSSTSTYAPTYTADTSDYERCDSCKDGEYVSFASWTRVGPGPGPNGQCFLDPTFQHAAQYPLGHAQVGQPHPWVPLTHAACPLSAQTNDGQRWRWVQATIPSASASGTKRLLFRLNTWDHTGLRGSVEDDGMYIDDVQVLLCRRP